jgi:ADP-ribose pyrophosphatase
VPRPKRALAQVLAQRSIYRGEVIDLWTERLRYPNGYEGALEIIRHPGASAVVPVDHQGRVVLVRQYRHAVQDWLLEVPAGKLDAGESAETCARREMAEEVALRPTSLTPLGSIYPTPGFANERIWLFLGTDLEPVRGGLEADELIEVVRVPLADAVALAAGETRNLGDAGEPVEMSDAKSVIAILRAAQHLA